MLPACCSPTSPLVKLGGAHPLQTGDLWPVSPRDGAASVGGAFRATLAATATESCPQGRLARALAVQYGKPFAVAGGIKLFHDGVMFLSPVILRRLLRTHGDRATAASLALALAAAGAVECLTVNAYFHILFRISLHARAGECLGRGQEGLCGEVRETASNNQHTPNTSQPSSIPSTPKACAPPPQPATPGARVQSPT